MASYQATVLADSPVLYLRFSETSGATCADSSTNAFTGTANGTFTRNVATGLAGLGVGITLGGGAADSVTVPSAAPLNQLGDVTLECWVKIAAAAGTQLLMSKPYDGTHGGYSLYLSITTATINSVIPNQGGIINGGDVPRDGNWHHVVFTLVGTTATHYLDGSQVAIGTNTAGSPLTTTAAYTIGNNMGTGSFPLNGSIDEVALYGSALSAARVSAHYNARNTAGSIAASGAAAAAQMFAAIKSQGRGKGKGPKPPQVPPPGTGPRRQRTGIERRKKGA